MSDIDGDLIIRLLELIKMQQREEDEEQKKKKEQIDEEDYIARLKHKVFGDPYPSKKKEKEE